MRFPVAGPIRTPCPIWIACLATFASAGPARGGDEPPAIAARREFFEAKIRPVLAAHCQSCHGSQKALAGLRVDWRVPFRKGGDSGEAFTPGHPDDSLLLRVLDHSEPGLAMPKKAARLPDSVVKDFRTWIADGAFDPRDKEPSADESALTEWRAKLGERRSWWSLQPLSRPEVPVPKAVGWANGPVDRFILSRLEASGLAPSPRADRERLARRLSFVLTGLPPTADDLRNFLADRDTDAVAYGRLVDRFLASPHFGEKWARHWMDVVRYGDTYGYEWDIPAKGAWRYRDYLIRAFNADVPFDRLVREQIAGDLLPEPRIHADDQINESLIGPMFFQLGEKRHGDSAEFDGIHQEMLHNKIDAFSKAFQGVTIGCARCHDHKLDAVSQRDYYALAGVFFSPRWVTRTLDTPARNAETIATLRRLKSPLRDALSSVWLEAASLWPSEWLALGSFPFPTGAWQKAVTAAGAEPAWEHPLRAWIEIQKVEKRHGDVLAAWKQMALAYGEEQRTRAASNGKAFWIAADFRTGLPPGWSVDGVGLRDGAVRSGDFTVALDGASAIKSILPAGLFTHAISPRLNGAIRSPYMDQIDGPWLSLLTCGGDFSAERTVVDNAFLSERQTYLDRRDPTCSSYPPLPELSGRRVYREVATKTSNPNFPPRIGLGGACSDTQIADPRSWFGITRAFTSKEQATPKDELTRFRGLFEGVAPKTSEEVARRYASWFTSSLQRWSKDEATDDDVLLMNWLLDQGLLPNRADATASRKLRDLVAEYRRVERALLDPQTVHGMADLDQGLNVRLNVRGDYDQLGPVVPRGYLGVFANSDSPTESHGPRSGRLELADQVASTANPLTARVYVNRVWQWVFGTGLVSTPDDFGRLGAMPSHPELLDHLAARFMERGWSTKDLVRHLVRSETFQQGSTASIRAVEVDPANRLLHHYPLRRLEAEDLRDSILAASGRLDRRLFGPPIDPPRSGEDPQKRLVSGPLDGLGRRSIYTKLTIMDPPRFLATFNQPPPKIPSGRRDVTSNPAQALILLNDPFVLGQAKFWADRVVSGPPTTPGETLRRMFFEALGRAPRAEELARWNLLVVELARERGVVPETIPASALIWTDVAHSLFNTKEFIYFR